MRSNRRRNWFIKRFALGLAIAAIAAPVAQARIDEGSSVQAKRLPVVRNGLPVSVAQLRRRPKGHRVPAVRDRLPVVAGQPVRLRHASRDARRLCVETRRSDRGRQGTPERQPERQDRVRPHAASVDRRAAVVSAVFHWRMLESARVSLSHSSSSASERRSQAATSVARRPPNQKTNRAAQAVSGLKARLRLLGATRRSPSRVVQLAGF